MGISNGTPSSVVNIKKPFQLKLHKSTWFFSSLYKLQFYEYVLRTVPTGVRKYSAFLNKNVSNIPQGKYFFYRGQYCKLCKDKKRNLCKGLKVQVVGMFK